MGRWCITDSLCGLKVVLFSFRQMRQKRGLYRVIQFCDLETKAEYRLVTNLPRTGEGVITDEEILEIYRCRGESSCYGSF